MPLQLVVWAEAFLFLCFGLVQAVSPAYFLGVWAVNKNREAYRLTLDSPNQWNKATEIIYVVLSMFAKLFLGSLLLANVII